MDEQGLWKLFWKTGLPEVYLALQGMRAETELQMKLPARTAFGEREEQTRQI